MSQELRIQFGITYANGALSDSVANNQQLTDQATQGMDSLVVSVGTSEQDLAVPDVTTLGYCYVKNLDPANFITYGPKSGGVMVGFGKLKFGESAVLRLLPGITFRWKADTAACKALVKVFND